jgi:hypothetical protein
VKKNVHPAVAVIVILAVVIAAGVCLYAYTGGPGRSAAHPHRMPADVASELQKVTAGMKSRGRNSGQQPAGNDATGFR